MKNLTNESKKEYTYYCDNCGKQISFKDKTLNKIYVEKEYNKRKHVCDLCNECYERRIKCEKLSLEGKEQTMGNGFMDI